VCSNPSAGPVGHLVKTLLRLGASFTLFLAISAAQAQVVERRTSAEGSGSTRALATQAALINASAQAFGLSLNAQTVASQTNIEVTTATSESGMFVRRLNETLSRSVRTPTGQPILGYTVNSVTQSPNGDWTARVTIRYPEYERIGADTDRRSVVLVPPASNYARLLRDSFEPSLVATRRFDVLARDATDAFAAEARFQRSSDAAPGEAARQGRGLGADYLMLVDVQALSIRNGIRERVRISGEEYIRSEINGAVKLEVLEFATRKRKWSGHEQISVVLDGVDRVDPNVLLDIFRSAARSLVSNMIAAIYPIRVVSVNGNLITINRGEGSVSVGESVRILEFGREMKDPQSGESLGREEREVAMGRVVDVMPKFATVRVSVMLPASSEYAVRTISPAPSAGLDLPVGTGPATTSPSAPPPPRPSANEFLLQ
jgi:hypothetical protein